MIVDMWMSTDLVTIAPETTISAAALVMSRHRVRRLLIAQEAHDGQRLLGIVSAGDVARAFPPDLNPAAALAEDTVPAPVTTIITRTVCTTTPDTPIEEAARLLRAHKVGALPVVRGDKLLGIITESDIFQAFLEMNDTSGPRITFDLDDDEDVTGTMVALCGEHGACLASVLSFHHQDRRSGNRRRYGVVRLRDAVSEDLIAAIWASGHRVVAVRSDPSPTAGARR